MNSDDEKKVFEFYGWEYDYIKRLWRAPDGFEVSTDDLMIASSTLGEGMERSLLRVARSHGELKR
jgi:hypothetical protein